MRISPVRPLGLDSLLVSADGVVDLGQSHLEGVLGFLWNRLAVKGSVLAVSHLPLADVIGIRRLVNRPRSESPAVIPKRLF